MRELVEETRAGAVAGGLQLSCRLLLLALGSTRLRSILSSFWEQAPPEAFAGTEARRFADYLRSLELAVPYLDDVLSLETAIIRGLAGSDRQRVWLDHDPAQVLGALVRGSMPSGVERRRSCVELDRGLVVDPGLASLLASDDLHPASTGESDRPEPSDAG